MRSQSGLKVLSICVVFCVMLCGALSCGGRSSGIPARPESAGLRMLGLGDVSAKRKLALVWSDIPPVMLCPTGNSVAGIKLGIVPSGLPSRLPCARFTSSPATAEQFEVEVEAVRRP